MGQDIELDFKKYCVVDGSPKTVLLSPRHSKVEKGQVRKKPKCGNEVSLSQDSEFTEISLCCYRSASCRTVRSSRLGVNEALKRGSVYQSSIEVSKMNNIREKETERRKKIEFSRTSGPNTFEIFDSLCGSDDDDGSFLENTPQNKSLSSRLMVPHSPTKFESDSSKTTSPKNRSSPFKKMFDPFAKSKTHKSPLRKSLIHDFSNTECDSKDSCSSTVSSSSPAHLHGVLKLGTKNYMPDFEFTVKNPNDVLVAKMLKVGNDCNWVYTFYSAQSRRRFKDLKIMGKMQVSCYLCTELVNAGAFDNSMLTEFVLYDLTRLKESIPRIPVCSNVKESSSEASDQEKVNFDLYPHLETAAIVIQFPYEKRESLKCKGDNMQNDDLINISRMKIETNDDVPKVSVVIPSANHGLPCGESGPSPLLDRWRLGGGCDCGGWDMGCPLVVFGGRDIEKDKTCKPRMELFVKGTKETTPALTMKMSEEGQYTVEFHAQLSSLQAFSICVAILHATEASFAIGGDKNRQVAQCDSLRVFIEDEVKHLIEAVAEEEKRKPSKNLDDIPSTFVVNPPFSPMSRA